MDNTAWSPSFEFTDGTLRVETPLQTMRFRWGDTPVAEEYVRERGWQDFSPEIRLLKPRPPSTTQSLNDKTTAFDSFRATVPGSIVEVVEPFPSHQWKLMVFLNFCKEARDLAISNRVLAYALANNSEVRHTSDRTEWCYAMRHVRRKQREICEALDFPGSEAGVRLFRKIPVESAFPPTLRLLKMALKRDPDILRTLGHLRHVCPAIVYLVCGEDVSRLVTPRLLIEVGESGQDTNGSLVADMLFNVLHHAGKMRRPPKIPQFLSIRGIHEFHDQMMLELEVERAHREERRHRIQEELEAHRARQAQARRQAREDERLVHRRQAPVRRKTARSEAALPLPPLPGAEHILPLTTTADLRLEGRKQHNCVGSYTPAVLKGRIYVYRVLEPERATLSIRPGFGGAWFINELKCACNKDTSKATRVAVLEWLDRYNLSL